MLSSHLAECDDRWGGRRMEEDMRREEGGEVNIYMLVCRRRPFLTQTQLIRLN